MPRTHAQASFAYQRPAELGGELRVPVAIVGAGPVGLACAIDLALQGVRAVVLDDNDTVSTGSRAICYAKRTLEVLDRLGCAESVTQRGVRWNVGKVFHRDRLAYQFDLLPEGGHKHPAFVNLQQYHLEAAMLDRLLAVDGSVRWKNRVAGAMPDADGVTLAVATPDGDYKVRADWVIACDGARSPMRDYLGLDWKGQVFRDRFLIADVHMSGEFPTERWFWFDPPFHPHQSVLLHRQADDVWRIDFQLGWDADPDREKQPERVVPRIRAMLGDDRPFELTWVSVYTFQCRRLDRFVHGRVLFAGDAAHQVSPFGARGANGGIQDADNLCWKLASVVHGEALPPLLDSYDAERVPAADENILNSTRSTDFITPKSPMSRVFRDAVLDLAVRHPFARRLVNSGRLSLPSIYRDSPLHAPDLDAFASVMVPGAPAVDAPVVMAGASGWLLDVLGGATVALYFAASDPGSVRVDIDRLARWKADVRIVMVTKPGAGAAHADIRVLEDVDGLLAQRYDATPGTLYLLRRDQHVAARWRRWDAEAVTRALHRLQGRMEVPAHAA